eukprot:gene33856-41765_t
MSATYGFSTTGDEIMSDFGSNAKEKHIVVTGSNVGLGFETARLLVKYGAIVTIACRSNGNETVEKIKSEFPSAVVSHLQLDLGSLSSVRAFAQAYKANGNPLHILINNAGVMATPLTYTSDGLETQFGVNHIGHFLLTTELLDVIKRSGTAEIPARIINLSSRGNRNAWAEGGIRLDDLQGVNHYDIWERYGASKLANILFAKELQRRFEANGDHVIAVSVHPGGILTELARHLEPIVLEGLIANIAMKTVQQGVATTLITALNPSVVPGEYYADCQVETKEKSVWTDSLDLQTRLWAKNLRRLESILEDSTPVCAIVVADNDNHPIVLTLAKLHHYRCALITTEGVLVEEDASVSSSVADLWEGNVEVEVEVEGDGQGDQGPETSEGRFERLMINYRSELIDAAGPLALPPRVSIAEKEEAMLENSPKKPSRFASLGFLSPTKRKVLDDGGNSSSSPHSSRGSHHAHTHHRSAAVQGADANHTAQVEYNLLLLNDLHEQLLAHRVWKDERMSQRGWRYDDTSSARPAHIGDEDTDVIEAINSIDDIA